MSAIHSIATDKLSRLVGTAACPVLVDVRIDEDFEADPSFVPGAMRRSLADVAEWAPSLSGQTVVVICTKGQKISKGVAAWLRHAGASANVLDGGIEAWTTENLPLVRHGPPRHSNRNRTFATRLKVNLHLRPLPLGDCLHQEIP